MIATEETCQTCGDTEQIPCPHNQYDGEGWCTICDYPGDEPGTTTQCPDPTCPWQ
jgi:hypothetical protein